MQFYVDTTEPAASPPSVPVSEPAPGESFYEQEKLLMDIGVSIPTTYQKINPGQDLLVELNLVNKFPQTGDREVTVTYKIKDEKGQTVLERSEKLAVREQATYARLFRTGYRLEPGKYNLEIYLPYPDGRIVAFSTIDFEVEGAPVLALANGATVNLTLVFQVLSLLLTAFGLIAYYELKQVQTLDRIIHQITEQDLLAKGFIHKF